MVYELSSTWGRNARPDGYGVVLNQTDRSRFGAGPAASLLAALWLGSTLVSSPLVAPEPSLPAKKAEARAATPPERSPAAQRRRCLAGCPTNAALGEMGAIKLAFLRGDKCWLTAKRTGQVHRSPTFT